MSERFYELSNTAEQIDKVLVDTTNIIENRTYNAPIVLKKGTGTNKDFLSNAPANFSETSIFSVKDQANVLIEGNTTFKINGVFIEVKRNSSTGNIEFTIGDGTNSQDRISFTINDIERLLALPNILPMSQADYEQIENPDNNTLYTTWDDEG